MYELSFDEQENLMVRRLWGFWTVETARAYVAEVDKLFARISSRHPDFNILSDSRDFPPQAAEVGAVMTEAMRRFAENHKCKIAIVVSGVLSKLQMERIYPFPHIRGFLDEQSAREWLKQEGDGSAA